MRYFDQGSIYTVSYNADDARAFSRQWPGSTVRGSGSFQFEKRNGNLVDATGSAAIGDGSDWLAFSQDCQEYGEGRMKTTKKTTRRAKATRSNGKTKTIYLGVLGHNARVSVAAPTVGPRMFKSLWEEHHGSTEVPTEMDTAIGWIGGEGIGDDDYIASRDAHLAMCAALKDNAKRLENADDSGYVCLRGQGYGEKGKKTDVWTVYGPPSRGRKSNPSKKATRAVIAGRGYTPRREQGQIASTVFFAGQLPSGRYCVLQARVDTSKKDGQQISHIKRVGNKTFSTSAAAHRAAMQEAE